MLPDGYYSGSLPDRPAFLQLRVTGATGVFKQVITVHLPPAEVESVEVKLVVTASRVCLSPAPRSIEPCLKRTDQGLEAQLKGSSASVVLARDVPDAR